MAIVDDQWCDHGLSRPTCELESPHGGMRCCDRKVLTWKRSLAIQPQSRYTSINIPGLGGEWLVVNYDKRDNDTRKRPWKLLRCVDHDRSWGDFRTLREAKSAAQAQMDADVREDRRRDLERGWSLNG